MRSKQVVGNWKMNGSVLNTERLLSSINAGIDDKIACEIGVCVPFVLLNEAAKSLESSSIKLGAQNVSEFSEGAYTGEVSATMLQDCGCELVLVGHSERRQLFNETDEQLVLKVKQVQKQGLTPIFCIGETEQERLSDNAFAVIERQVGALLKTGKVDFSQLVLAYEPIWAIGTGLTASPEQAQKIHAFIRGILKEKLGEIADKINILYGGSVNATNAESLFKQIDIDGGLIGGASLDAKAFISICQQAK